MDIYVIEVGPAEAKELLAFNTRNRNLRTRYIAKLADDMRGGAWRDGGSLLFAGSGEGRVLIDGQHRLHAVVAADVKVNFVIVENLAMGDQQAVDTGMRRSLADVLKFQGEPNCTDLAATLGWYWRWSNGAMKTNYTPTVAQALDVFRDHPGLRDCFSATRPAARTLGLSRGLCAFLFYVQQDIDAEDANAFWDQLATGLITGVHERHPLHALRRQLESNQANATRKFDSVTMSALLIKAWNMWRDGREIQQLVWRRGGASPELFPELKLPEPQ